MENINISNEENEALVNGENSIDTHNQNDDKSHVEEVLKQQQDELNAAKSENEAMKQKLEKQMAELKVREHEMVEREKEIAALRDDLDFRAQNADSRENDLAKREISVRALETEALSKSESAEKIMQTVETQLKEQLDRAKQLDEREAAIRFAEAELENKLAKMRSDTEKEMLDLRESTLKELEQKSSEAEKELEQKYTDASKELSEWRTEQRRAFSDILKKETDEQAQISAKQLGEVRAEREMLKNERYALAKEMEQVKTDKENLQREKEDLVLEKRLISAAQKKLEERAEHLDEEAEERADDLISQGAAREKALKEQCELLREQITAQEAQLNAFETLRKIYGDDPRAVQLNIASLQNQLKECNDKLVSLPDASIKERCDELSLRCNELQGEVQRLENEKVSMQNAILTVDELEFKLKRSQNEIETLNDEITRLKEERDHLSGEISRLNSQAGKTQERIERIKSLFDYEKIQSEAKSGSQPAKEETVEVEQPTDEIEWLKGISRSCTNYQISFPKRILYAFHTALKIADWSTVTVLAGVSGTGKSELPRLYSSFGGINFINVAVQPNWDSQEAMLGYFNSIDNRFDAQPLLRFLVNCTEDFKDDPDLEALKGMLESIGYSTARDNVNIVLLDEMNLAHVELYFADFLSKLEERRGKGKAHLPKIEVKLGAGILPYKLKLSRNVLWVGTMNQDETTKSLSDKVLDRGIVINFPRPKKLNERSKLASLDKAIKELKVPQLKWSSWESWQKKEIIFPGDQGKELETYKQIVEKINGYLAEVGRALGHRVWQSIEFYIANYPEVIAAKKHVSEEMEEGTLTPELQAAMHTAFEDQIVQKIMPKLRGIDTKGRSREDCLDMIKELLESYNFNLSDDFDVACRLGYGQFIWSSANYIDTEDRAENANIAEENDE